MVVRGGALPPNPDQDGSSPTPADFEVPAYRRLGVHESPWLPGQMLVFYMNREAAHTRGVDLGRGDVRAFNQSGVRAPPVCVCVCGCLCVCVSGCLCVCVCECVGACVCCEAGCVGCVTHLAVAQVNPPWWPGRGVVPLPCRKPLPQLEGPSLLEGYARGAGGLQANSNMLGFVLSVCQDQGGTLFSPAGWEAEDVMLVKEALVEPPGGWNEDAAVAAIESVLSKRQMLNPGLGGGKYGGDQVVFQAFVEGWEELVADVNEVLQRIRTDNSAFQCRAYSDDDLAEETTSEGMVTGYGDFRRSQFSVDMGAEAVTMRSSMVKGSAGWFEAVTIALVRLIAKWHTSHLLPGWEATQGCVLRTHLSHHTVAPWVKELVREPATKLSSEAQRYR